MKSIFYHPSLRVLIAITWLFYISLFFLRLFNFGISSDLSLIRYIIIYSGVTIAIIQVLKSTCLLRNDKFVWVFGLLFLPFISLPLYIIVFKRIHGYYIHPSKQ